MNPLLRHPKEQPRAVPSFIRVRDVVRHGTYQFAPGVRMLRVPYDLFNPVGPVQYRDELITYLQGGELIRGRAAECKLEDSRPGERVLLQLPPAAIDEWWLCEIEEVFGIAAD